MDATVAVTFLCAVLAAASTGVLVGRCIRVPRIDVIAWACAAAAITVSLGGQALGAYHGYTSGTFRTVQVGAQLVAPLCLAWGLVELGGKTISARFGAKLVVAALTVVGAVVLVTDPLASAAFSKSWPPASVHYQIIPRSLLSLVAGVTVAAVIVMLIVGMVRLRGDPRWRQPLTSLCAAGVAAVAILGLRLSLGANLAYAALCAVCAVLAGLAVVAVGVSTEELHGWVPGGQEARPQPDEPGDYADDRVLRAAYPRRAENGDGRLPGAENGVGRLPGAENGVGRLPGAENGVGRLPGEEDRYRLGRQWRDGGYPPGGSHRPEVASGSHSLENGDREHALGPGYQEGEPVPVGGDYEPDEAAERAFGLGAALAAREAAAAAPEAAAAAPEPALAAPEPALAAPEPALAAPEPARARPEPALAGQEPAAAGPAPAVGSAGDPAAAQRLFGLIIIYSLAEGQAGEFDALAERIVSDVRLHEPDTLIYAVHSVPNAPLQRIVYEVYRDETAYEEHQRQAYIQRFDAERATCVLATNVIRLGTQQAKLSPLPGLSQIFGHTAGG